MLSTETIRAVHGEGAPRREVASAAEAEIGVGLEVDDGGAGDSVEAYVGVEPGAKEGAFFIFMHPYRNSVHLTLYLCNMQTTTIIIMIETHTEAVTLAMPGLAQ